MIIVAYNDAFWVFLFSLDRPMYYVVCYVYCTILFANITSKINS